MDLDSVKRYLEKDCNENAMNIDGMPFKFFEPFVMQGLRVDLLEPGRIICSMKVPPRLLVYKTMSLSVSLSFYFFLYFQYQNNC